LLGQKRRRRRRINRSRKMWDAIAKL
jgi:hypothetical protein